MSNNTLVARALEVLDPYEQGDLTAALIRAVDAQYPEGYDEAEGLELDYDEGGLCTYMVCETCGQRKTHAPTCHRWNTRVALLALCRDITGEKG